MPKISFVKLRKILLLVLALVVVFSSGYFVGTQGFKVSLDQSKNIKIIRVLPPDKSDLDFSLFWEIWDTLETRYFDQTKLDKREMVYGAIRGMVQSIGDPYTVFLPPRDNQVVNEDLQGSFEGVGIQIGFKGSQLAVISPLPDSPAEKAGIKAGDFIIGIIDKEKEIDQGTVGITLPEAVKAIRGRAGSKVTLILTRDGSDELISIEVTRTKLEVPSVILAFSGSNEEIAHLKLLKFGVETNGEWQKAVSAILQKQGLKGIVLDLRNNPGGYLEGAVDIAAEFLKNNSLVTVEERSDGKKNEFRTERVGKLTQMPMAVLVNGGSASAAEILAGALKDNKRAKIVGEITFGKGSIQEPLEFNSGSGLHITVARWLTPSGFWVNEKGLEPDVKVEDDEKTTEDEQLQKAIELLK